jgi:HSP20 family protein
MPRPNRLLSELAAIEQQLNQLFEGSLHSGEQLRGTWSPPVDIYETPSSFVLTAEVPGVQATEIEIKVVDRNLILRGERRWERDAHGEHFHRLESAYGKFERTFNLSERIDAERITAGIEQGVLTVVLPKHSDDTKRRIEVQTE